MDERATTHVSEVAALTAQVEALTRQVHALSEQTAVLVEQSRAQTARQEEWDDLKSDITPVMNDVYLLTVEQLAEVEPYVRLEDILHLVKRLARNTRNFEHLLDQLESLQDLIGTAMPLSSEVVHFLGTELDAYERKGYFAFAREGLGIADRVVSAFSADDVRQLGDNIVLILSTVKAMTQPEIMNLASNLTASYQEAERDPALRTGMLDLVGQMRDPEVRRGLALTMRMLRAIAAQTPGGGTGNHRGHAPASDI